MKSLSGSINALVSPGGSSSVIWIALLVLLLDWSVGLAQQSGVALYFANEEFRFAKLIERKEILD
ncbi:MAG: hypothetical protein HW419_4620, partial [Deltaproteobacteria bacterium]|nr:hypothetical protein [Deltaproteobacteria bacterium]